MTALGVIALVFGVLGVLLTILQNVWCWPAGLISVIASVVEFYDQRLFGDMTLQVFYFVLGIYGWWYWSKNKQEEFKVTTTPRIMWLWMLIATLLQAVIYFVLLKKFKGDKIVLDSILTAASITGTYMMTKKWLENWIVWVIIDATYIFLYGIKDMWSFALLFFVFTIMAGYGYYSWKRKIS